MKKKGPLSIQVEAEGFYKWLPRLQATMRLSMEDAIRQGARLFARSAARHTPPLAGKRLARFDRTSGTKKDLWNRAILPVVFNLKSKSILPADRQRALIAKNGRALTGKAKRSGVLELEFWMYRKIPTTRKFVKWVYSTYEAAKAAAKIETRGLLRAGWWGNVLRLGETAGSVAEQYGTRVSALLHSICRTKEQKTGERFSITVTNAVTEAGAASAAAMGIGFGFGAAKNQMIAIVKKGADGLKKVPF